MSLGELFLQIGVVILALAFMGRFAGRIGLTPIPLYLIAGLGLGQLMHLEGAAQSFVHIGAEIGAVLLLFMLGLEYTSRELEDNLRANRRIGLLDLALNFTPGVLAGVLLGFPPLATLLMGGVTYLSSSGIVSKVLADLGRFGNRETPVVLAVCVLEDVAMAFYLPVVAALLIGGTALQIGGNLLLALGAFGLTFSWPCATAICSAGSWMSKVPKSCCSVPLDWCWRWRAWRTSSTSVPPSGLSGGHRPERRGGTPGPHPD
ncbi:cation:proton antiporter [Deinococcus radiophilus]|uniref:cation:proton antiporter n=1 Tax=Deinococcus radiophilus TaxID=32062 RepID=UPI00361E6960